MPIEVTEIEVLREYLNGVMERADHHGNDVNEIAIALAGAIIWCKDEEPIEVFARDGELKNVLWARINGQKYAFSYNHDLGEIEMRQGTTQGNVVHSFTNLTTLTALRNIFTSL